MFKKPDAEKEGLDLAIDDVLREMRVVNADSPEFAKMVKQLTKLYKIKACEKPERVSKDTMAIVAGNLMGIGMIIGYERANIVTSKALNFIFKLR